MITIDELMTVKPYTLRETDTLEDARGLMTEKHIRHIPITDDDNHLTGLVTQRDILQATIPGTGDGAIKLGDIMIKDVSVIRTTDSVRNAAIFIQQHKYGCLPVVEDKRLIGIITDSDFIGVAVSLLEQVDMREDDIDDVEPDDMDDFDMPVIDDDYL
jgi:CBS domain-containing protein